MLPHWIATAVVAVVGVATKFYAGPAEGWVRGYAGGVLYVIFWILVVRLVFPRSAPAPVALAVFAATSLLEVLQLLHPALLESVRATFVGHALLGSTFAAWDFPHYAAGAIAGALVARRLDRCSPTAPEGGTA